MITSAPDVGKSGFKMRPSALAAARLNDASLARSAHPCIDASKVSADAVN